MNFRICILTVHIGVKLDKCLNFELLANEILRTYDNINASNVHFYILLIGTMDQEAMTLRSSPHHTPSKLCGRGGGGGRLVWFEVHNGPEKYKQFGQPNFSLLPTSLHGVSFFTFFKETQSGQRQIWYGCIFLWLQFSSYPVKTVRSIGAGFHSNLYLRTLYT